MRGSQRIVVPHAMIDQMLQRMHEGHLGIEKCKKRARGALYWPNMNDHIAAMSQKCATCMKYRDHQPGEPLTPRERYDQPWMKVGCDLFYFQQKVYLLVVDYYSNYPEIATLSSETSTQVIRHMKAIFARHGIPAVVVADNGPCFGSQEFREFAERWEFRKVNSSPRYPKSNGLAENGVKIVKRLLKKAADQGSDPYLAVLAYRDSPVEGSDRSPAELLMGRKLRTRVPNVQFSGRNIVRRYPSSARKCEVGKRLPPLCEGDVVRVRGDKDWAEKAVVMNPALEPNSWWVQTESGKRLRRNRQHLQSSPRETYSRGEFELLHAGSQVGTKELGHQTGAVDTGLSNCFRPDSVFHSVRPDAMALPVRPDSVAGPVCSDMSVNQQGVDAEGYPDSRCLSQNQGDVDADIGASGVAEKALAGKSQSRTVTSRGRMRRPPARYIEEC